MGRLHQFVSKLYSAAARRLPARGTAAVNVPDMKVLAFQRTTEMEGNVQKAGNPRIMHATCYSLGFLPPHCASLKTPNWYLPLTNTAYCTMRFSLKTRTCPPRGGCSPRLLLNALYRSHSESTDSGTLHEALYLETTSHQTRRKRIPWMPRKAGRVLRSSQFTPN